MCSLRVFIVVSQYIVYYTVYHDCIFVEMDDCVYQVSPRLVAVCCISELHAQLCPYHNAWPEAVLQELQCLQCCLHVEL